MKAQTIEIMKYEETAPIFHTINPNAKRTSKAVPADLFRRYFKRRELYIDAVRELDLYFKPVKDKRMRVEKNHIKPGEIHKFNDDGTITIRKKNNL